MEKKFVYIEPISIIQWKPENSGIEDDLWTQGIAV